MNIVFLGPPGSGKGTQAKQLAAREGLAHLSTGDLFREAIANQSDLGKKIKTLVDAGKLVPDGLVSDVVFDKWRNVKAGTGVLLDGYPRTVEQAQALEAFLKKEGKAIDRIVFFQVDSAELVKRISARRQCPACKEVYNLLVRLPSVLNKCDRCSAELFQRPDDEAGIVQKRLDVYEQQTKPLLNYYRARSEFVVVNAARRIEQVSAEIASILEDSKIRKR